ncbi:hypothetical protein B0H17DRAFT_1152116 [Mycena rosella]|uniref:Secreted protein n=1 Tax=Mycena rosella TaxID=1033263 RepID=A0AAD7FH81_MYCRO|nr:hypothetical protein B0H17DRAFT_1152116 [Mycena rosella]
MCASIIALVVLGLSGSPCGESEAKISILAFDTSPAALWATAATLRVSRELKHVAREVVQVALRAVRTRAMKRSRQPRRHVVILKCESIDLSTTVVWKEGLTLEIESHVVDEECFICDIALSASGTIPRRDQDCKSLD